MVVVCINAACKGYRVITLKHLSNSQNIPLSSSPRHDMGVSQKSFQQAELQHTNKVNVPEYVDQMLTRRMERREKKNPQVVKMEAKPEKHTHSTSFSKSFF